MRGFIGWAVAPLVAYAMVAAYGYLALRGNEDACSAFFVGLNAGSCGVGLLEWRRTTLLWRERKAEREEFFARQRAELDDIKANNERRYVELRKKLGIPPEWRS